jgi:hypothetical protein
MPIDFSADLQGAGAVVGAMQGVMASVDTNLYISDVLKDASRVMSRQFNQHMHAVAASAPQKYHHVYEWNKTGVPGAQLWVNQLKGFGRRRTKTFQFIPSKTTVPMPDIPPSSTGKQLTKEYVFAAKAWVMEYGIPVAATTGTVLIYLGKSASGKESQEFIFSEGVRSHRVGGEAIGQFTAAFIYWHETVAPVIFETQIRPRYEQQYDAIITKAGTRARAARAGVRTTSKSFSIGFEQGYAAARAETLAAARKQASMGAGLDE